MIHDDGWFLQRVTRIGPNPTTATQFVNTEMDLVAVRSGITFSIIAHDCRQKVELHVWSFQAGMGANKTCRFKMIGCSEPGLEEIPARSDEKFP